MCAKMTLKEVLAGETKLPKIKVKGIRKIGESAIVGEDTYDEINLDEIDVYLDSCKPKYSEEDPIPNKHLRETGGKGSTSLKENFIENLFYKLKNKSNIHKINNVEGKMECPFCKILVKNIKIHFERKIDCGNKINMAHFIQTYVAYEKIKIKEGNKLRQQILKEKDPAKYKEGQKEAQKKLREKDPAKHKENQKKSIKKLIEKDPAKYKENQKEAKKKLREKDPAKHK